MPQALLFADPKPLVKQLGRKFFQSLPRRPGVYLMRDARENILCVGKAKNLRQRLNSYRVANPDRLSRRHLRLLREVVRIEWKVCRNEFSALAREAELLRCIRPKFNRAGVWSTAPQYLLWRLSPAGLHLQVSGATIAGWQDIGPLKGARWLRLTLARLCWLAVHAKGALQGLPAGWLTGKIEDKVIINSANSTTASLLQSFHETGVQPLINWIRQQTCGSLSPFESSWLEKEMDNLAQFRLPKISPPSPTQQSRHEQRLFAFA